MEQGGNAVKNLLSVKQQSNKYNQGSIKVNLQEKNDSHAIIANMVEENSICLDVGCAVGYIGEVLHQEKKCKVYGIEIDQEALQIARQKNCYEEIYDFSITDTNSSSYQSFMKNSKKYDYILFADILEHLIDPGKVLYEFSKKLKPNGKILISIPNIAHIDIVKNLIDRTFNYNITGLLDNTHLRFFTKNSFIEMINNINEAYKLGLEILDIKKTTMIPSYISSYPNLYEILNNDQELCVFQYIYEIEKKDSIVKNKISKKTHYCDLLEHQLSERNSFFEKINEQWKDSIEMQNQIEELKKREMDYQDKISQLELEIQKILNSKSWKITEPIRRIKHKVSKNRD